MRDTVNSRGNVKPSASQLYLFEEKGKSPKTFVNLCYIFREHPNEELSHGPVVDWVTEQYVQEHGSPPRDPWRSIRQLHQDGKLIKVRQGIYKYDPNYEHEVVLFEFSPQEEKPFLNDGHRCVVCGRGPRDARLHLLLTISNER